MSDWQKAAERLRVASERYKAALQAEQDACSEWVAATEALDAIERTPQESADG